MKQQNKIHVKHPLELAANMRVIYTFYFNSILRNFFFRLYKIVHEGWWDDQRELF